MMGLLLGELNLGREYWENAEEYIAEITAEELRSKKREVQRQPGGYRAGR